MLMLSALWIVAGRIGAMKPPAVALALGAVGVVIAPTFAMVPAGFGLVLGTVGSAALLAASVGLRNTPTLVLGALGLFAYLTGTIVRYLSDTIGVPVALLLSGVVLVGVAVATSRLKRLTGAASPP